MELQIVNKLFTRHKSPRMVAGHPAKIATVHQKISTLYDGQLETTARE